MKNFENKNSIDENKNSEKLGKKGSKFAEETIILIAEYRINPETAHLTQKELAEKIRVDRGKKLSPKSISEIENIEGFDAYVKAQRKKLGKQKTPKVIEAWYKKCVEERDWKSIESWLHFFEDEDISPAQKSKIEQKGEQTSAHFILDKISEMSDEEIEQELERLERLRNRSQNSR